MTASTPSSPAQENIRRGNFDRSQKVSPLAQRRYNDRLSAGLIFALLISGTFLQKLALPGTGGALPFSLVIIAGAAAIGFLAGRLVISSTWFSSYLLAISILALASLLSTSPQPSWTSLIFLFALHFPYVFRFKPNLLEPEFALVGLGTVCFIIALCGLLQFGSQFLLGPHVAFFLDFWIPNGIRLIGFNSLYPLEYGSEFYKSNGVFMLEPSHFSQILAIGILAEALTSKRLIRLGVLCAAMVTTYSGTGPLLLFCMAPLLVNVIGVRNFIVGLIGCLLLLFFAFDKLNLELYLDRLGEFGSTETSGFARFISAAYLIRDFLSHDLQSIVFGRGPGTITEYFEIVSYETHDPTWGKAVYEYGVLGSAAYFMFFFLRVGAGQAPRTMKLGLLLAYLMLGGYLLSPLIHAFILAIIVWPAMSSRADSLTRS